ncbi:MAG: hypothetical protein N3B17_01075 [Chlorobi bacterium]|nr:hypothetical protein [Chlorobiota bacterium]
MKLSLVFLIAATLHAFQIEPTALLRGTVRNGNQPARVEMLFRDETGKTIRAKSAADGTYQTVLSPGHSYSVTITTENLERYTFTYTIPPATKYTELTQDFSIGQSFSSNDTPTQKSPAKTPKTKSKKSSKRKK